MRCAAMDSSTLLPGGVDEREALIRFTAALKRIEAGEDPQRVFEIRAESPLDEAETGEELTLADAVPPEPPAAVAPWNGHFSASALNMYVECGRKWFYRYLCAAVDDEGSSASFYGTAFHSALQHLHDDFPHPSDVDAATLNLRLEGYVNAAMARCRGAFKTAIEHEMLRRRALRTAKRYVEWLVGDARRAPFTIVGRELEARLEIEGYPFLGYIDRLDRDDRTGNIAVYDYKTGTIASSAAEYRNKIAAFTEFQLPFYYWARTAEGDRVTRLALVPLKDALRDVRPIALEVVPLAAAATNGRSDAPVGTIGIGELERSRARMVAICRELRSGTIASFPVTADASACTYCTYAFACARRPAPLETRFGR